MRVPLSWLASFVELPSAREELAARLTSAGLEVQQVLQSGPDFSALRVGEVLRVEKHPNADKLNLCSVSLGGDAPLNIVCGAHNVVAGARVAVAPHGAHLPGGVRIKRSKIRGVTSNGMICSERELGLSDEHAGILLLETKVRAGAPLSDVLGAGDAVFDFEITPNRGDWVSLFGIAREVRALFGGALTKPPCEPVESAEPAARAVTVSVDAPGACHHYLARVLRGVRVGASPAWLVKKLEAAGLRSINNVVDVTNLVMLEFGQPLHAFDLDILRGTVRARVAREGETLRTLDGQTRKLKTGALLIADDAGPRALAGVMGGAAGEVGAATRNILIESAHFSPVSVRRAAREHGLATDASYRFERGVDPDGQARAADRAARLISELAGGEVLRGHVAAEGKPAPAPPSAIALDPARLQRLLGVTLTTDEVRAVLARVEVSSTLKDGVLLCAPPRYRADLREFADLAEEVARIHGYDTIAPTLPPAAHAGVAAPPRRALRDALKTSLAAAGFFEVMSVPWIPEREASALRLAPDDPAQRALRLRNPIHAEAPLLRTQLVGSLLRCAAQNLNRQVASLRLFECCRVFHAREQADDAHALPEEPLAAVALLAETRAEAGLWNEHSAPLFFRMKGAVERVLEELQLATRFRAEGAPPFLHPGASGVFEVGGAHAVSVGELHPACAQSFGIEGPLALAVFDAEQLFRARTQKRPRRYREVSRHPQVQRDLAMHFAREHSAGALLDAIRKRAGKDLSAVQIFDRYEGRGVPTGRVSLAFRLSFQRVASTLTDAEVSKTLERVVDFLQTKFGGERR